MSTSAFESHEALQLFVSSSSKEKFQEALPSFSLMELADSIALLQTQPAMEAKNKLNSVFEWADSPATLEFLGKSFSPSTFIHFLEFVTHHSSSQHRLTLLLVGLPSTVFSQALHFLKNRHLHLLRQEGPHEPLQYQLTQFIHEGESLKKVTEQNVLQFQQELSSFPSEELTQSKMQALEHGIENIRNQLLDYLERASTALAIVWHTDRADLIEKLSSINEAIQHQLTHLIGHPAFENRIATGIYAFLEQTFSNIFDSSLEDEDASIEGMTRLSLWHLKDYWEIGLLPSIQHPEQLDLNAENHTEKERLDYQQKLTLQVQQQLERLGIEKVAHLKKLHLFSKSLLKDYITQHQHLLLKH